MFELSLHILDLVQNSVSAGATLVRIVVAIDAARNLLSIEIEDDGRGMDEDMLARVTSPFTTSRKTRKVGLGIPMFKQCAEMCAGSFEIASQKGKGTRLKATFALDHVDRPPLGDLKDTMLTLIVGSPEKPEFLLDYRRDGREFLFDTREIRGALGGLPLGAPEIAAWIGEYLTEGIAEADGAGADAASM